MSCGSILTTDQIFRKLYDITLETKRRLVGKYITGDKYETDFRETIYHRNGEPICSNKFDFSPGGTKCLWCNTFSFLFDDGEIISNCPIYIETGLYKGRKILIKKYPKMESVFGKYKPSSSDYHSVLIPINDNIKRTRMINDSCEISHKVAISSLINSSEFPFKSNILGAWVCDTTNTVEVYPQTLLMETIFTERMMRNTFFQIFLLSGTSFISHGAPSFKSLMILNENCSYQMGPKKIDMNSTLFIEPSSHSSFAVDYNNRLLFFVGKDSVNEIVEPHWRIEYELTNEKKLPTQLINSPAIPEYLQMRLPLIRPTHEMMNYIRMTGINVFPILYLYLYITILLLNRSFYELFLRSDLYIEFNKIFVGDDASKYIRMVSNNLGKCLNEDEILQIIIDSDIRLRIDGIRILGGLIQALY